MVDVHPQHSPMLTVITPAYNEAANLPVLHERLRAVLDGAGIDWEWIIVDDHSRDGTPEAAAGIVDADARVRYIRFARNFGSHTAIVCGLDHARGAAAAVLASDLQDPPETIPALLEAWRAGNHVVWAVRAQREGESRASLALSRLYYVVMRRMVGLSDMPSTGADFFLIDRKVIDAVREFRERNVSLFALITWMGFRQAGITYDKQARIHGASGWNLEKRIKLLLDSVMSFSYAPIRWMSLVGILIAVLGFCYSIVVLINGIRGQPVSGWSSLMIVVLVLGGTQMIMMGVLGEYLWRAFDESRARPRYTIEIARSRITGSP